MVARARPRSRARAWRSTLACGKLLDEKKIAISPIRKLIAAVSAGVVDGDAIVDLNYEEDKGVSVDFNLVATEDGEFVEVQGSGEEATFSHEQFLEMLSLGHKGIADLIAAQRTRSVRRNARLIGAGSLNCWHGRCPLR